VRPATHWALPNGDGPTQQLDFTQRGTQPVASARYDISGGTATGSGTLVVTSPVSLSSNAAVFTVTCPSTAPSSSGVTLTFTAMRPSAAYGDPYTGDATAAGGTGPYTWTATGLPPGLTASVTATGGDGTYTWTGTFQLPTGLTATPNGGTLVISGTPTALGTWVPQGNVSDSASEPTPETLQWHLRSRSARRQHPPVAHRAADIKRHGLPEGGDGSAVALGRF
jgi:hypothetical protein